MVVKHLDMTAEEITGFLSRPNNKKKNNDVLKIIFKKRTTIDGIIVRDKDYEDLKEKNFRRIFFSKIYRYGMIHEISIFQEFSTAMILKNWHTQRFDYEPSPLSVKPHL